MLQTKILFLIAILLITSQYIISFKFMTPSNIRFKSTLLKISLQRDQFTSTNVPTNYNKDWVIDLLYDSHCPICMMEVEFLTKRDIDHKIRFTDLQSPDYNPSEHGNVKFSEGMRKIRAVLPDQTVVTGVNVFRKTYEAIGLGWVFQLTKIPFLGDLADKIYDIWAENRLRITGRGELADVLKERSQNLKNVVVDDCDDTCGIDYDQ